MSQVVEGMEILRHMLGMGSHIPRRDWYSRNYFNSSDAGPDNDVLQWLEAQALVIRGRPQYWHVTRTGMKAVGMTEREIAKAFPPSAEGKP